MTTAEPRLPWFRCYPGKLLGALAEMTPAVGYVYVIVLLRIYEVRGPCRDNIGALARRTGFNKRVVIDSLDTLCRAGKLRREGDGIINPFAEEVMNDGQALHETRSENGRKGGLRSGQKRKWNQISEPSQASFLHQQGSTDLDLDLERKKDPKEANASLAQDGTVVPAVPDERTLLFRTGLATLVAISGKPESQCRALVGKWLREMRDDAVAVRRVIEDAARERPANPVPWIVASLNVRRGGSARGDGTMAAIFDLMGQKEERG